MTKKNIKPWAIILAAGQGLRLAATTKGVPKQFLNYRNFPLYYNSARVFSRNARLEGIIYVFPKDYLDAEQERLLELQKHASLGVKWLCVAGGERRQDSVYNALNALEPTCTHVLIHDAARPFLSATLVESVCKALEDGHKGVIPGIKLHDTIKRVRNSFITKTLERNELFAIQTPQGFELKTLYSAHKLSHTENIDVTDDASLLEYCNCPVYMVEGEATNIKITEAEHMQLLNNSSPTRVCNGFGYDVHRFGAGRPLKLGGVLMQGSFEVIAHSDGDVVLHALMDALLGCAGLGDIGQHFPDNDATFDNMDSAVLLNNVLQMVREKNIIITHVDVTIVTQKPKVGSQKSAIAKNIAHLLNIPPNYVNVKATTEEGLGFTGNGEGIKAFVMVSALSY